jgi:hypothetical protein
MREEIAALKVHGTWSVVKKGLNKLGFQVLPLDPGMYYGQGMIIITYADNTRFFRPDLKAIEQVITKENLGYGLTQEEGDKTTAFAFLGVSITPNPLTKLMKLTQSDLIEKVLEATGMADCNTRGSPSLVSPLGIDADEPH